MAITINGSGITSSEIADGTITTDDISSSDVKSLKSGRKNLIINGGFNVWQRGETHLNTTDVAYHADRWKTQNRQGSQSDIELLANQVVDGKVFNVQKMTVDTAPADGKIVTNQYVEHGSLIVLGKTYTVSYWARQSTGTGVQTYTQIEVDDANGVSVVGNSSNLTSSWQRFSQTFTFSGYTPSSISNTHLRLMILFTGTAAGDVIEFTGVQLETGSVATDFEQRSYGEELALCQRYYHRFNYTAGNQPVAIGIAKSSTKIVADLTLPVTMRAQPTTTVSSFTHFRKYPSNTVATAGNTETNTKDSLRIVWNISGNSSYYGYEILSDAAAHISADAEL